MAFFFINKMLGGRLWHVMKIGGGATTPIVVILLKGIFGLFLMWLGVDVILPESKFFGFIIAICGLLLSIEFLGLIIVIGMAGLVISFLWNHFDYKEIELSLSKVYEVALKYDDTPLYKQNYKGVLVQDRRVKNQGLTYRVESETNSCYRIRFQELNNKYFYAPKQNFKVIRADEEVDINYFMNSSYKTIIDTSSVLLDLDKSSKFLNSRSYGNKTAKRIACIENNDFVVRFKWRVDWWTKQKHRLPILTLYFGIDKEENLQIDRPNHYALLFRGDQLIGLDYYDRGFGIIGDYYEDKVFELSAHPYYGAWENEMYDCLLSCNDDSLLLIMNGVRVFNVETNEDIDGSIWMSTSTYNSIILDSLKILERR